MKLETAEFKRVVRLSDRSSRDIISPKVWMNIDLHKDIRLAREDISDRFLTNRAILDRIVTALEEEIEDEGYVLITFTRCREERNDSRRIYYRIEFITEEVVYQLGSLEVLQYSGSRALFSFNTNEGEYIEGVQVDYYSQ